MTSLPSVSSVATPSAWQGFWFEQRESVSTPKRLLQAALPAIPVILAGAGVGDDDDEELGNDEDDLTATPPADDESNFDDFDDEFDDYFEEEEDDPYWDHPDDGEAEPPPGKGPGKKK